MPALSLTQAIYLVIFSINHGHFMAIGSQFEVYKLFLSIYKGYKVFISNLKCFRRSEALKTFQNCSKLF